jgi:2-polyprenyl-6-methoxyphenol hydroxylase-like FAD-dependent oxidoreductase
MLRAGHNRCFLQRMMHAVICGAGVTGLALAAQLGRSGWKVVVLTPAAQTPGGGFLVKLCDQGLVAARRLGLMPYLMEHCEPVVGLHWIDRFGRTIAYTAARQSRHREAADFITVLRRNLEQGLLAQMPGNVEVRSGCNVTALRTPRSRVDVVLDTGETLSADLLIGADGVHSHIRDLTFGDGTLWSRSLGYDRAAFVFKDATVRERLAGKLTTLSVPGRHVALCPLGRNRVAAVLIHRTTRVARRNVATSQRLEQVYGDLQWCVPSVLRHAAAGNDLQYEQAEQLRMPAWHRGRIALLGEACHAFSLWPGQGTSIALAAAFALGREIVRARSFDVAFQWYEEQVTNAVARQRIVARRAANWLLPSTPTELALRNGALRLAALSGAHRLVRTMLDPLV